MKKVLILFLSIISFPIYTMQQSDSPINSEKYTQPLFLAEKYSPNWYKELKEQIRLYKTVEQRLCHKPFENYLLCQWFTWYKNELPFIVGNLNETHLGYLPLYKPVHENNLVMTNIFLMLNADPNYSFENTYPTMLFHAHSVEMAELLVAYKANPQKATKINWTVLHKTLTDHEHSPALVAFYLEKGIKPDVSTIQPHHTSTLHVIADAIIAYTKKDKIAELEQKLQFILTAKQKPAISLCNNRQQTPLDIINNRLRLSCLTDEQKTALEKFKKLFLAAGAKTYNELKAEGKIHEKNTDNTFT